MRISPFFQHCVLPGGVMLTLTILLGAESADSSPGTTPAFEVKSLIVRHENRPPSVIEWPKFIEIADAYTTAAAEGTCRLPRNETWQIGFTQIIVSNVNQFSYSDASLEYTFSRLPVDDCSRETAPMYAFTDCVGTGKDQRFEVAMSDRACAKITWRQIKPPKGDETGDPDLRSIDRNEHFVTWLLARRVKDNKLVLLKRFAWSAEYHGKVNPTAPLGARSQFLSHDIPEPKLEDPYPEDPEYFAKNKFLETRKDSNEVQLLKWHSKSDTSPEGVVIPGNWNVYR